MLYEYIWICILKRTALIFFSQIPHITECLDHVLARYFLVTCNKLQIFFLVQNGLNDLDTQTS